MADQNELQKKTPVVNVYDTSINTLHATNVDRIQAQANQINVGHVNTLHFHLHVETGSQPQEKRKQNLGIPAAGDTPSCPGTMENIIECGDDKIIYDVDRKIGDRVYVGRIESSIRDEKEYAVKLRAIDSSVSEAEFRAKYLKEVEIANKLDDRVNVARYRKHHVGRIEQELTLFLVTQLCKHEKWENLLPKFTIEQKKILLVQLCHGLEYIHDNQISHRDLKPSNVLLSLDGKHIKIIDFGISKEFALNKHTITTSSGFSGTLGWVASEMCSDDRSKEFEAWVKADIYSLGLLIYFIFTDGKHPYKGDCCDKHQKIKNKEQPDFSVIENDEEFHDRYLLIDLLTAMLSHEPNARPGITEILQHCFTWDVVKKMSFIKDCHRYFVKPCDEDWGEAKGKAKRHLEHNGTMEQKMAYVYKETIDFVQPDSVSEGAPDVEYDSMPTEEKEQPPLKRIHDIIRGNWIKFMKEKLEDPNSGNSSSYGNSFADLVCYIRNTHENYDEKPTEVKRILCSRNEGMWNFFASNFPEFFIYLFHLMKNELKEDDENRYLQERAKNCELPQK